MTINLYEVGGCVRDDLLGIPSKDIDFAVEIDALEGQLVGGDDHAAQVAQAFTMMRTFLEDHDFTIFLETPEHGTIRARFPRKLGRKDVTGFDHRPDTADFVLCRKDGPSSDGRRPDWVEVGTLADDLARRDFTVNAMARKLDLETFLVDNRVIDQHDGLWDLKIRRLRFVGDPMTRLREDGLRALRAIRFMITKDFELDIETRKAICDPETATLLSGVSVERRRDELEKCFKHNTLRTMEFLSHELPVETLEAIFTGDLRLAATMRVDEVRRPGQ